MLLTCKQLAMRLGISVSTVRRWTKLGLLPHYRLNRVIRYREEDVLEVFDRLSLYSG